jgi:hypothetical protein
VFPLKVPRRNVEPDEVLDVVRERGEARVEPTTTVGEAAAAAIENLNIEL